MNVQIPMVVDGTSVLIHIRSVDAFGQQTVWTKTFEAWTSPPTILIGSSLPDGSVQNITGETYVRPDSRMHAASPQATLMLLWNISSSCSIGNATYVSESSYFSAELEQDLLGLLNVDCVNQSALIEDIQITVR